MELLVEIEAKKDGEEVFFYDIFLDDLIPNMGATIATVLKHTEELDTVIVYLSDEVELLELWEVPVTRETCAKELLETFNKIVKRGKNEDQRANSHSSNTNSTVR